MPTLDDLQTWVDKNIRKGLTGSIFVKRWEADAKGKRKQEPNS